jgi:DNA-binding CsgD family transcriptional regulator
VDRGAQHLRERRAELGALERLAGGASEGRGGLIAIQGPAGIGKSALLREAGIRADAAGLHVLRARGGELEQHHPFGLVRQLLEPVVVDAPARQRARLLAGPAGAAAPALGLEGGSVDEEGVTVLHGLHRVCARLATEQPLWLAIDDVHWSDPATLRWLVFLAARSESIPLAVAIASRPPEISEEADLLVRLLSDPAVAPVRLTELSEGAVAEVVSERWPDRVDPAFADACYHATGGNPFLLRELLDACQREDIAPEPAAVARVRRLGPAPISQAMLMRLGNTSEPARAVARAVAVLGTRVPLAHAAALADVSPQEASDAADVLAAAGILAPIRPLEFVHPVIRSAVYGELAAAVRSRQHGRAARLLEEAGAPPDEVAAHLVEIEPSGDLAIVERLRTAAARALAAGSPDGAVRFLERALVEPPPAQARATILFDLGRARSRAGSGEAIDALREALAGAEQPRQRAEITLELVPLIWRTVSADEPRGLVEAATAALDPVADRELLFTLEAVDRGLDRREDAERLSRYRDVPGATEAECLLLATVARRVTETVTVNASEAADLAIRALRGLEHLPVSSRAGSSLVAHLAFTLLACDRVDVVDPFVERWVEDARQLGMDHWFAAGVAWQGGCAWLDGDLPRAEALLLEGIAMRRGTAFSGTDAGPFLVLVRLARGDQAGAQLALSEFTDEGDEDLWRIASGALALADGVLGRGVEDLLAYGSVMERSGQLGVDVPFNWRAAVAPPIAQLGRADEARELLDVGLGRAHAWGTERAIGKLLHARGIVEQAAGGDGLEMLEGAVELLAPTRARLDYATALVDLGAALRRANSRAAARPRLREGYELALACGAIPLAERARAELQATGARLRDQMASGIDELTPSERRVVALAADGRSNPQIAQELFVTIKTVETHLGHSYRKLGIRSRSELARVLAQSGDPAAASASSSD